MPSAPNVAKAKLEPVVLDGAEQALQEGATTLNEGPEALDVQFNPETLKVAFSNQKANGGQSGGSALQYVGRGTTKLSLDLLFDVTREAPQEGVRDVRDLTSKVVAYMRPVAEAADGENTKFVPPGVRFTWGSFLFEGVMDSVNETLEFFSNDGRPLRATVAVSMSQQDLQPELRNPDFGSSTPGPGTVPQTLSRSGDSVQQLAARSGRADDWKKIAAANGIENPRHIPPGTPVNMNAA